MIECYAKKIAKYFCDSGVIPQNKLAVYEFFFETFFYKMITYSLALVLFVMMDKLIIGMIFLVVFMGLRSATGGYHTSKAINCMILSPIIIGVNVMIIKYLPETAYWLILIGLVVAMLIIHRWAPLSVENNILTANEIQSSRRKCKCYFICTIILVAVLWRVNTEICVALGMAYISDAILLYLGVKLQKRRCKYAKSKIHVW